MNYILRLSPGLAAKLDLPFELPFIASSKVGAKSEGGGGHTLLNLEYMADWYRYLNHPEESNVGQTFVGTSIIPSNLFGGKGKLVFGLKELFRFTTDPPSTETGKFYPRYDNEWEVKAKYTPREKISMSIAYANTLEWYKQKYMYNFNYTKHIITPALYYNLTSKSSLFIDTDFGKIIYRYGDRDSQYFQISGGASGNITAKTSVYFKAGMQFRTYTHKEIYRDYNAFTTTGNLSTWLRKDIMMKLMFSKDAVESVYQNNAYFDATYTDMSFIKQLTGKLSLLVGGTFGRNDYQRNSDEGSFGIGTRRDYIWGLRGGFAYKLLEWVDSNATYEFKGRDSNFRDYNYRDNRIMVNIRAAY